MVGEFPELQGIMGRYYALHDGEGEPVADAIAEHYRPLGPNDDCPTKPVSVVAALSDKIDTLVAFFVIGEKPTGSRDPYGLRRAAQGVIRLILENELRVPLRDCLFQAVTLVHEKASAASGEFRDDLTVVDELYDFFSERLRVHLREQGVRHDLIDAVFVRGWVEVAPAGRARIREDDFTRFIRRVRALRDFLQSEDGANLLIAYRRASNIVAIEEGREEGCAEKNYDRPPDRGLFRLPEEHALYQKFREMGSTLESYLSEEKFDRAMSRLATLRRPVDEFFDKVTVNTEDAKLRENRLRLLARIRATMNRVADFSQIEG